MTLRFYDAHNHLQDGRFGVGTDSLIATARGEGVAKMVVNGSAEEDWPKVAALARKYPEAIPSFGYHPWYMKERTPAWRETLTRALDEMPAGIGEVGLDRWIKDYDTAAQEEAFVWQLQLAAGRNLPLSIHCLQAWGRMQELLEAGPRPACGFVLHSYGGSRELVEPLARLGAYFSLPGYFAHERKNRQRDAFLAVPRDRLLIETDAPDQSLPPDRVAYPLPPDHDGKPVNHPANLIAVYRFAAELFNEPLENLAVRVEKNFMRLFAPVLKVQR